MSGTPFSPEGGDGWRYGWRANFPPLRETLAIGCGCLLWLAWWVAVVVGSALAMHRLF